MISIKRVDSNNIPKAIEFLKSVPSIEQIDEQILNNACIALNDEKIIGCISFEKYDHRGLIRYFVFKKALPITFLEDLLECLENTAKEDSINSLVCVAESEQIEELFKSLKFEMINKKNIFIDEEHISNTSFSKAVFLSKELID